MASVIQGSFGDEKDVAASSVRHTVKEQSFTKSYNYYPDALWGSLKSDDTMRNKFKQMANFMVDIVQCRNPDQNSKRIMVSTVHVASGTQPDPEEAYRDVVQFSEILKTKRDANRHGMQSMRVFPDDPQDFIARYPSAYPENMHPVKCKVSIADILERATKSRTPLRLNNATLRTKTKTHDIVPADIGMNAMMQNIMGSPMMAVMARTLMQNFMKGLMHGDIPNVFGLYQACNTPHNTSHISIYVSIQLCIYIYVYMCVMLIGV